MVRVGDFLARHVNEHFCDDCLAVRVGASAGDVRRAIVRLASEIVLDRVNARCVACARQRPVIGFVTAPQDPPERVMTYFMEAPAGHGMCHACLAIVTGLSYLDVRRAIDRLRLTRLRVGTGPCGRCGRLRVLIQRTSPEAADGGWSEAAGGSGHPVL